MAIRKAIYEKVKKGFENYINKGKVHNRSKRIGELYKSGKTDEAEKAVRKTKTRDKLVGIGSGVAAAYGYSKYKESPYKLDVSVKKKTAAASTPTYKEESKASDYKAKASKVTAARKEQVKANEQKNKANKQMVSAKSNKTKVAANKTKVIANARMVAANKKKVAANAARYKKG